MRGVGVEGFKPGSLPHPELVEGSPPRFPLPLSSFDGLRMREWLLRDSGHTRSLILSPSKDESCWP
jgi:hypothetical protein